MPFAPFVPFVPFVFFVVVSAGQRQLWQLLECSWYGALNAVGFFARVARLTTGNHAEQRTDRIGEPVDDALVDQAGGFAPAHPPARSLAGPHDPRAVRAGRALNDR